MLNAMFQQKDLWMAYGSTYVDSQLDSALDILEPVARKLYKRYHRVYKLLSDVCKAETGRLGVI